MNDTYIRFYQFLAAVAVVLIGLGYCFVCLFIKPVIDLTAPILGIVMLLLGYYWGSSKSSQDKGDTMKGMEDKKAATTFGGRT